MSRDARGRFVPGHHVIGGRRKLMVDADGMRRALREAGTVAGAARKLGVGRLTLWRRAVEAGLL